MKYRFAVYIFVAVTAMFLAGGCATMGGPRAIGNVTAEELKQMLDEKQPFVLIDNRTEYEFREGRIPGSINIPTHKFDVIGTLLPPDKTTHLVFYCRGTG
jgi:rhodanese-related sulfurtransferase